MFGGRKNWVGFLYHVAVVHRIGRRDLSVDVELGLSDTKNYTAIKNKCAKHRQS
jgi:hypothetical protein